MLLEVTRITVPLGHTVFKDSGESRASRIAYSEGTLEIMTPLPAHEVNKVYLSNFVEILLEELDIVCIRFL